MRHLLGLLAALLLLGAAPPSREPATLIHGARLFDGTGSHAKVQDVLIRGKRIVRVGRGLRVKDATVIDARGMTLLPGLHDLHIHTRREAFESRDALSRGYAAYLASGVTSVNEYSIAPEMLAPVRGFGASTPHLSLAIRLGVPSGHGTEYDYTNAITAQVTTPAQARAAMARLLPLRPDVIKVFADGWRYGRDTDRADIDLPTLSEIVRAAHARGIPVVTHTVTLGGAKLAARAGVDALVHGIGDALADRELIRLMKRGGTAYVPTLAVYEPQQDRRFLPPEWARLQPEDREREERRMGRPGAIEPYQANRWQIMRENVRILHRAGIRFGIGTDTGIGGVYQGLAAIREIRLLTTLGFTPAQALRAATAGSARIMGQQRSHGRIAPGMRADLLLVAGKPDQRIEDLYAVRRVWVSGREIPVR